METAQLIQRAQRARAHGAELVFESGRLNARSATLLAAMGNLSRRFVNFAPSPDISSASLAETKKHQPALRLIVNRDILFDVPRRYPQSTSDRSSSHVTTPPVSRSIAIASDSPQELSPYATLRRWPKVVPHREASDSRSGCLRPCQNDLSSIRAYHHTMMGKSTSFVGIHRSVIAPDNCWMKENPMADIRRQNLSRLLEQRFDGNRSALAREYGSKQSYISDLLRPGSGRSFGEKAARTLEERIGLLAGQLDVPDSPLLMEESRRHQEKDEAHAALEDMDRDEIREVLATLRRIRARRAPKSRKTA